MDVAVRQLNGLLMVVMPIALALIVVDIVLLAAAVRLFQRETILTRWK